MFFQFSPPVRQPTKKLVKEEPEPEDAVLSLAPFTPNPKLFFENVKVGQTAVERLIIKNPNSHIVQVMAKMTVDEEISLHLNWSQKPIEQNQQDVLEISWTPTCAGAWRYMLHINSGKMWRDIPVVLKCASSTKKRKAPPPKNKGLPRFVAKKTTSPIHNLTYKRKSPVKRAALPNITNIPEIKVTSPERKCNGKENSFILRFNNFVAQPLNRRDTYVVNQNLNAEPVFDDSLEKEKVLSPSLSFEKILASESFTLAATPKNDFNPEHCSTDERSVNSTATFSGRRLCLFSDVNTTFDAMKESSLANISNETYTKHNLSSETYTKNSSIDLSDTDLATPPSFSKKTRLESLAGSLVKNTIQADLWTNARPSRPLLAIKEESSFERTTRQTPLKRKSDLAITLSPKRPNLGTPHLTDWTKQTSFSIIDPDTALWLEQKEPTFIKWLNAVLAPPTDLTSNEHGHPVDVVKLWKECQKREIEIQPVLVTSSRLNALRKSALSMYRSKDIQDVLSKVWASIDMNRLSIRTDRDVHLDLALQADVMSVLLSYNPLWLRLGLETIYGRVIPLKSNSDIVGLTSFLWERFIRDPILLRKYKSIHSSVYSAAIKKHILKKFFALVYFLDYAKTRKLIPHDPCLFCKNAPIKESREALLLFSRDTLSSMGDVTKYLKHLKYVVEHKQTYLNEFDYTVNCLGVDLRDGVRLTRVMEITLLQNDLSKNLRVPAISRLQKVHNMKIVFEALKKNGFELMYEITPKDIVDGHKEKTLSFLWQIIHKFQTPLMKQSVTIIAKWWRSERILQKREELRKMRMKKEKAAAKIQRWYRRTLEERQILKYRKVAVKIQSYVRMFLARRRFLKLKHCVSFVEEKHLANKLMKVERLYFECLKYAALVVQRRFRANKLRDVESRNYNKLREAAVVIQRRFRVNLARKEFTELKNAVIFIQRKWKAKLAMRAELEKYEVLKATTIMIQRRFRANLHMKKELYYYEELKRAVIFIQKKWRSILLMRKEMIRYESLRYATIVIQRRFRTNLLAKADLSNFHKLKKATVFVQQKWRAKVAMRMEMTKYQTLRRATVVIQRRYRETSVAKSELRNFQRLKNATIFVQRRWRANLEMRTEMKRFRIMKNATVAMQRRFRANQAAKVQTNNFQNLKRVVIFVQRKWRAKLSMRVEMRRFEILRSAVVTVQRRRRANISAKLDRDYFTKLKEVTIYVQRKWRALLAMRIQMKKYQTLRQACIVIQRRYRETRRARLEFDSFRKLKLATMFVQGKWRAKLAMRAEMERFQALKKATIVIQQRFRANEAAKVESSNFQKLKKASIFVQRKCRAKLSMRVEIERFQILRMATITIQRRFRASISMKSERDHFDSLKKITIFVQRQWRAKLEMRTEMNKYHNLRKACISIQRRYRETKAAKLEFDRFQKLKLASIFIQEKWRGKLEMRAEMRKLQVLKNSAVIIQRRFRAKVAAEEQSNRFRNLKRSVIFVQRKWRAKLLMRTEVKRFEILKGAVVKIQRRFRGNVLAKLEHECFQRLKRTTIFVQRKWRAKLAMRIEMTSYQNLRRAAIVIQQRYRATATAKLQAQNYQKMREAAIFVQRKRKATLVMRAEMKRLQALKNAAITVQRRFREIIIVKRELRQKLDTEAATAVQKYVRGYLVRQKYAHFFTPEAVVERKLLRIKSKAATRIQAAWKGYKLRSSQTPELYKIYEKLKKANENAVPENTLGSRCNEAVLQLSKSDSLGDILHVFNDLEFITRRCQKSVKKLSRILPKSLYETIISTNRSPPEIKVCTMAASILINFYRYQPTRIYSWMPEYIERVITVMLHCCDKETSLFPTLCTLVWFFLQNEEYKKVIVNTTKCRDKMMQIKEKCERRARMVKNMNLNYQSLFVLPENLPLPSVAPDWGLEYKDKPKVFKNSLQAYKCMWTILKF